MLLPPKVLVDEATQAVEPSVMIPITRGAKQVVMIGDQAQLPPTCKCPEAMLVCACLSVDSVRLRARVHACVHACAPSPPPPLSLSLCVYVRACYFCCACVFGV